MKFISQENTATPTAQGTDVVSFERIISSVITPFKLSLTALVAFVQANLTFPSQTLSASTPSRAIGTAFQPSSTKVTNCTYSVNIQCSSLLLGNASGKIELLSDAANPPTTVRATVAQSISGVLSLVNGNTQPLAYKVPIGHYVLLKSTTASGTVAYSIVSQTEQTEG